MCRRLPLCALAFGVAIGPALAQSAGTAPAPVPATPQSTSATFGDWVLNCQRIGDGAAQKKLCEVTQTLAVKGQNTPLAKMAVGRLNLGEPLRLTVVMPVNITPATAPRLLVGDKPANSLALAWLRCLPGGCYAAVNLDDAAALRLRTTPEQSRITFHDGADRDASLPLSPRGLPQALDALAKEDAKPLTWPWVSAAAIKALY